MGGGGHKGDLRAIDNAKRASSKRKSLQQESNLDMGYTRCFQILASCPIVSMIYCRVALLTAVCNHEPMVHSQSVLRSRFIFLLCNLLRSRRSVPITSVKKYKAVFPIPQAQKLRSLLKAGTVLYCMSHIHILTQWAHPTWFINKR